MTSTSRLPLVIALTATFVCSAPVWSSAQPNGAARSAYSAAAGVGAPTAQGWGAAARFGCQIGLRYGGAVPGSPWHSFTGGMCLLALIDAIF